MSEKSKKKDDKKNAPAVEPTPEPRMEEKPPTDPAASVPLAPLPRRGTVKRAKPRLGHVSAQASATGTSPLVLAALRAAYGWTDRTRLTRLEFLRKRDEWLARPASEV